ncbi:hypothetical protein V8G54_036029 [Vigna mungo]|uniref:Reverse transcriptase domain-containing protein n=1 Tax=Vigna mungo TaxID=3915 RepID=A0AAQ3MGL1_VIGMU
MVEKLQSMIEDRNRNHDSKMDEIKLVLHCKIQLRHLEVLQTQILQSNPIKSINPVKDISLGFLHFNGSILVLEWIFKVDKFFNYHNTPDADRIEITSMHFEKDVKIEAVTTWATLMHALESQFGPSTFDYNVEPEIELPQDTEVTVNEDHHLSLNALKGGFGVGTIRFVAHIGTMPVKVLIDGGGSDNFLQPRVAKFLKLPMVKTPSFKFLHDGRFTTFQGDKDMLPETTQLHHIRRMMDTHALVEAYSMQMDMELELVILLQNYNIVFSNLCGLPPPKSHIHFIPLLEGSNPVKSKGRNEKLVEGMLKEGIVQPRNNPFSSPIILVNKKDGIWRVCTDYTALNAITIKDNFPIPTVDELIDELYGACYFSKLDLRSGYCQILLKPEDRHKTTFRTHQGLYEWSVMPFELSNVSATFQSLMNQIFKGVLRRSVLIFFDDILVYNSSWKDHLHHLEVIGYLGHTLAGNGIAMETEKLEKDSFKWSEATNKAFQELKLALTTTLVLAIPNFDEPFYWKRMPRVWELELFIIKTDHKSLKELLEQTLQTHEQQQWLPKFIRFDFTIQYSPGKKNIPTDSLSRSFAMAWSEPLNTWLQSVVETTRKDEEFMKIFQECMNNSGRKGDYAKERIMLPNNAELINLIIGEFHGSKIGGHASTIRTMARLSAQIFWPKMREDIRKLVKECTIFQQAKEDIAMDFIISLPISQGYSNIMVVIDRLSKFAHFIPLNLHQQLVEVIIQVSRHHLSNELSIPSSIRRPN